MSPSARSTPPVPPFPAAETRRVLTDPDGAVTITTLPTQEGVGGTYHSHRCHALTRNDHTKTGNPERRYQQSAGRVRVHVWAIPLQNCFRCLQVKARIRHPKPDGFLLLPLRVMRIGETLRPLIEKEHTNTRASVQDWNPGICHQRNRLRRSANRHESKEKQ